MLNLFFDHGDNSPIIVVFDQDGTKIALDQIILSEPSEEIKKDYPFTEMMTFQELENALGMKRNTLKKLLRETKIGTGWEDFTPNPEYIKHGLFMRCKHITSTGSTDYVMRITPKGQAFIAMLVKLLC